MEAVRAAMPSRRGPLRAVFAGMLDQACPLYRAILDTQGTRAPRSACPESSKSLKSGGDEARHHHNLIIHYHMHDHPYRPFF